MKKPVIGILLGTVVYFAWGMVSWMALPWHDTTIKRLPEEQLITDTLKTVVTEPGLYMFPSGQSADGKRDDAAWTEKFKRGPVGLLAFQPTGHPPMSATNFVVSLLSDFFIALITMMVLSFSRDRVRSIVPRALLVAAIGLLVDATVHVPYWNWMNFPLDYTVVSVLDGLIGFLLLGFAQARFVPEA